ncbi:nuclear transport factor 2 family protein [Erythrobacter sp. GH1-10]|uniref:nuclear transport factor 2 family protein n=1 Tax=Erythrobacter sp. GH1-10 TaxID=3349334 RepID=UPI003877CB4C
MAEIAPIIEASELRLMQAWMHRDAGTIRKLAARDFMMILGTNPPELLDRPSFVAAIERDLRCSGFRLGENLVRQHGRTAWFTAGAELEVSLGAKDWSGRFLLTGLWRKFRIGGWKLVERGLSKVEDDGTHAETVRRLQLWR